MKFNSFTTSHAMACELGERLKRARLNLDLTQQEIGLSAGISRYVVKKLVKGDGKVQDLMALLIALDCTDQLDNFLPPQQFSPIEIFKLKGKIRKRASGNDKKTMKNEESSKDDIGW